MVDEPVVAERGMLTAPDAVWDLAVRRAEVIGPLARLVVGGEVVGGEVATQLGDLPAAGVRTPAAVAYRRWRGVRLDPGPVQWRPGRAGVARRGRGGFRDVLRGEYLTRQKKTVAAMDRRTHEGLTTGTGTGTVALPG